MKTSFYRKLDLYKPRTRYECNKCACGYKVFGDTFIENSRSVRAVDNRRAYRIFWVCHSGHIKFRGYTLPVSWKKNLGGDQTYDDGFSFEDEETEIANEWKELEEHARRMRDGGSGKKYF